MIRLEVSILLLNNIANEANSELNESRVYVQ